MAIPLTGSGGLFTRWGRIGKLIYLANGQQAGIPAALDGLFDQFDGDDRNITGPALAAATGLPISAVAGLGPYAELAALVLLRMVRQDNPSAGGSIEAALREVIRQMDDTSDTVKRATVGNTPTAISGGIGDGSLVVTTTRGDGLPQENLIAETVRIAATNDSYSAQATAGAETFGFFGSADVAPTRLDYDWPRGSGIATAFPAVYHDRIASDGTLLSNGGFESFTVANTPDDWTIVTGAAGTEILSEASTVYAGSKSLRLAGSATLAKLTQDVTLVPLTSYAFCVWIKRSASAAAGQLRFELVDGAGAVTTDLQGASNTVSVDLTSATYDAWTAVTGVWRLGKSVPSGLTFQIRMNTALTSGRSAYLDNLTLTPMFTPYAGGPGIAVFGGATPFAAGDGWTVAFTNNRGGSTYGASFQTLIDRLFGMKELGLVLPSDASPTIADSLITS